MFIEIRIDFELK